MSRMALMAFVMAFMAGTTTAGLCDLAPDESGDPHPVNFPGNWQDDYLDRFQQTAPTGLNPFWGPSSDWDRAPLWRRAAGDDVDRWWYAYLDQGRYRFLDETQYTLLDGPVGLWQRWRQRAWLDVIHLSWSAPVRPGLDEPQIIPELATATLLALGALVALRRRRHNSI